MNNRENILRTIKFKTPKTIPMSFQFNASCQNHYDVDELYKLIDNHQSLFSWKPNLNKTTFHPAARKDEPFTDPWGCVWETTEDGITGGVHNPVFENWDNLSSYKAPNPNNCDGMNQIDWDTIKKNTDYNKEKNNLTLGMLPHGYMFLRLQYLRGYENMIMDMFDESPELDILLKIISDFYYDLSCKYVDIAPDIIYYPEDLGMQVGPMLSPGSFKKYIKPIYKRVMQPAIDKGILVHMHSDGDLKNLMDDIIDCGIDIINPQDIVNGIDWLAENVKGRVCIDLDIDRQNITVNGSPKDIDDLIHEEVEKLGSKNGGLMMMYGLYANVPMKNIKAIMDAMEKYSTYYS